MYVFDNRNYKFNQTLLQFLGLWPYKKTKFQRLRAICCNALLLSYVLVQFAQFTLIEFHSDVVIRILSEALPATLYIIKFNIFFYNVEAIKQILEQITNNWRMLTDMQEIKIAEYYTHQGRQITIFFLSFVSLALLGYTTMALIPDILDFFLPLNESRVRYLPSVNEYDGYQGYFYPILLYCTVITILGLLTLVAVGSMIVSILLHCCAILKIASHRMEHSVDEEIIAHPNRKRIMIERIIKSVELHRNAQKIIQKLISSYMMFFLVLVFMTVVSLSINLFRLLQAITYMDNFAEFSAALGFVIGHELFLFMGNYSGQLIMDHGNELFNAIYRSLWYIAPVSVQRLLLFMLQCNMKSSKLNVNGLFVISLEGFSSLSSMSMSYFTMIYSTQQHK